ncbi:MAG: peptidoglycan-binding domain-containing protein [Xanthobacteraceae bacterium]
MNSAWDQADLAIQHPRSQWAQWGVSCAAASRFRRTICLHRCCCRWGAMALPSSPIRISRLIIKWNSSLAHATTAAYYATRLAGAPAMDTGAHDIPTLGRAGVRAAVASRGQGFDVGEIDGKIGAATRSAVKEAQLKLGMPADSYATPELISRCGRCDRTRHFCLRHDIRLAGTAPAGRASAERTSRG